MTLYEKSLKTLEFPKVLELLSHCAVTEGGKGKILSLFPLTNRDEVETLQEETEVAVSMLLSKGSPPFSGVKDVALSLSRAQRGGSLNPQELLDIGAVLRASTRAFSYGDGLEKTSISHLFHSLSPKTFLEEKIFTSILSPMEIADAASSELAQIRRKIRGTEAKVRDILQKLLSSSQAQYLQEPIITQRSGRFVVPVKSEHKNAISGMVHDVSASGSSFFVEPMAVVNANNELRELQAKEEKEIQRILAELSARCAEEEMDIAENYLLLVLLDVIFAKGQLALSMGAMKPKFSEKKLSLIQARHPLLDKKTAVPNDLSLGEDFDTLMITGPNTGGKTVTLKTLGLLTAMAQCGLHIPAGEESQLRIYGQILADIGDEQSIAQSLSTFSSHMSNIVKILEVADESTLILLDELGAGTDPSEGAALATAIIGYCRQCGANILATTHYPELKLFAMTTPMVENASCEFDVETLAPTYRLLMGIPGKSNAFAISRRLGLSETIIEKATEGLSHEALRFEDVLSQLDEKRQELEKAKSEYEELKRKAKAHEDNARGYKERLERQLAQGKEKAQKEAQSIIDEAREASDLVFAELKDLKKQQKKQDNWQAVNEGRTGIRRVLNEAEQKHKTEKKAPAPTRPAQVGDVVELISMGTRATVTEISGETLKLEAGILKISAKQKEVRVLEGVKSEKPKVHKESRRTLNLKAAPSEVDLRGMESLEALAVVEQFLDAAVMSKRESVYLIHGKGTGALRNAIRSYLKTCRYAKSYRPGLYGEGEDGVTVVELK
ncbi:MAG: endonuclease MutS2 [Eubacteriales bacterium]